MASACRPRLLRFLESGDIQRVGAERAHLRADVRVVAASSVDLQARIHSAAFRRDLYARFSAIRITIPRGVSLREYRESPRVRSPAEIRVRLLLGPAL